MSDSEAEPQDLPTFSGGDLMAILTRAQRYLVFSGGKLLGLLWTAEGIESSFPAWKFIRLLESDIEEQTKAPEPPSPAVSAYL